MAGVGIVAVVSGAAAEAGAEGRQGAGSGEEVKYCQPHLEREKRQVEAYKVVAGTPMCEACYHGTPLGRGIISEEAEERAERAQQRRSKNVQQAIARWERIHRCA